jgi:hypothetical protein
MKPRHAARRGPHGGIAEPPHFQSGRMHVNAKWDAAPSHSWQEALSLEELCHLPLSLGWLATARRKTLPVGYL